MVEKTALDGRIYRSATTKLRIIQDAAATSIAGASVKHSVSPSLIAKWRDNTKKLEKLAAKEQREAAKAKPAVVTNGKSNGHSNGHTEHIQTTVFPPKSNGNGSSVHGQITGLGAMIAEVRAVVIKELSAELGPIIEGIVDQRMGEIVAREIRKALDAKS